MKSQNMEECHIKTYKVIGEYLRLDKHIQDHKRISYKNIQDPRRSSYENKQDYRTYRPCSHSPGRMTGGQASL